MYNMLHCIYFAPQLYLKKDQFEIKLFINSLDQKCYSVGWLMLAYMDTQFINFNGKLKCVKIF